MADIIGDVVRPRPDRDYPSTDLVLRVQLLGPFQVRLGSKIAGPWPRLSAKRLLALVFLSPNHRIARDIASEALFADLRSYGGRQGLIQQYFLGPSGAGRAGRRTDQILCTERSSIYVSGHVPVEVDLDRTKRR